MLHPTVVLPDTLKVAPATYARQCAGSLVDPSVRPFDALKVPAMKRSSVAVGSIWMARSPLAFRLPST
jgi:hypothetical protein